MSKIRRLPDFETVWARLQVFAEDCIRSQRPIYTLQKKVKNYITDVKPKSIGRWSEKGWSENNQSRLTKGQAEQYWDWLCRRKGDYHVLYFVPAFMLAALDEYLEYLGGGVVALREGPLATETKTRRLQRLQPHLGGRGGGEGEVHRGIKLAIHDRPNELLARIQGGPFTAYATEFVFPTGDRIDVVLRDVAGNYLLVEVKSSIDEDDIVPYAQVAKYRTLWHILENAPLDTIRCLVAAPAISTKIARRMFADQGIESLSVKWR